ncbi:hypothetical protein IWX49DRAFT_570421 [Phyllosticta citricarpa]|uniref:Uncharacterized protein n=1 Tax=Phyllosticta paracitricarpa TaxID=2016321 RepID=A0ABR1NHX3_9PEZI
MSFQLFPAPPRKPRKQPATFVAQSPASPEPAVELAERAKAPGELHELIIKIDPEPTAQIQLPGQAHTTDTKTYQAVAATDGSRQRPRIETSCASSADRKSPSSAAGRQRSQSNATQSSRTFSPKSASSLSSKVDPKTTGSPALSESATLIGTINNSSPPVMRSIFPRYNPSLRLSQQAYKPTQASPTHIPKEKISKSPYSPEFYIPHGKWTRSESPEAPYYTPLFELVHLWNVANNKLDSEAKRTFSLQLHRGGSRDQDPEQGLGPQDLVFGTSPVKPLYMLQQSPTSTEEPQPRLKHEVLISRHHPTKAEKPALPIAHLDLNTPPPHRTTPDVDIQDTSAVHVANIHSKLAALSALEAAANSPEASRIALVDPTASSPAAAQLAATAVAESESRYGCQLFFCPISEKLMEPYETNKSATYELRHPQIGALPVVVQGDVKKALSNLWGDEAAEEGSRTGSPDHYRPLPPIHTTISLLNPFATPRSSSDEASPNISSPSQKSRANSQSHRPLSPAPDEIFVRLDLTTHALTIDAAALTAVASSKGGDAHKYVIDTAVSAVLAVAVAESRREGHFATLSRTNSESSSTKESRGIGGGQLPWVDAEGNFVFEGPPTTAAKDRRSKVRVKWGFGERSKATAKETRKQSGDLEAGTAGQEGAKKRDELPFVAELVLWVVESAFKVVVFVLGLLLRAVAKIVVGACRCVAKA